MRIGFDYGGTKIAGVIIDDGQELAQARVPTPRFDYSAGVQAIHELTQQLETAAGGRADTVGIGVPGSVDRVTGAISLGNSVWINGRDLRGGPASRAGTARKNCQRRELFCPVRGD